jgi:antitoxin ChpS
MPQRPKKTSKTEPTGTFRLRRIGGSRAVIVPPAILTQLSISDSTDLTYRVEQGNLIIVKARRRPSLEELCATCDRDAPLTAEDKVWLSDRPRGREAI